MSPGFVLRRVRRLLREFWLLLKAAVLAWRDDHARSYGAALAYYTLFSIGPLLLIVISIAGADGPVDIVRDEYGVPHIYASTVHDLGLGFGYAQASDRLAQMDLFRHVASGTIAELFGARSGLGFQMQLAQDLGRVDTILAICLAIVFFVIAGDALVLRPLSRRLDAINGGSALAAAAPGAAPAVTRPAPEQGAS